MFNITTVSALILSAGMTMTANVQAKEVSVEQFVDNMLAQSTAAAMQAIRNELHREMLTASNSLSIENASMYAGNVKITDLPSEEELKTTDLPSKVKALEPEKEQVE
jgi:hypothetical protein